MLRLWPVVLVACGFHGSSSPGQPQSDAPTTPPVDAPEQPGDAPEVADAPSAVDAPMMSTPRNCAEALAAGVTTSGLVMIDPDGAGGNPPFQIYCDQTTAGGGWALVWVYGFTDYGHFDQGQNAVSPRPTWGTAAGGGMTATSTTIPTSPTTTGALDFTRWASLGDEVMATSDINNWVKCQPGTGSVVAKQEGTVTCQPVKTIVNMCTNVVPSFWSTTMPAGVSFNTSSTSQLSTYYFYEGSTQTLNWPTHDPCGANGNNQKDNVPNPHGQLWIRHR